MKFPKRTIRIDVIVGVTLALGCAAVPIHNRWLQLGLLIGVALAWSGCFVFLRKRRALRVLLITALFSVGVPFLLPARKIDPGTLRADYVSNLSRLNGVTYVWGGESNLGIDCSGLPRRALRDALWNEGMKHANGASFRMWLSQWIFDSSAAAMGQGYRGRTRPLGISGPLWELDQSPILPGDLAVRGDGGHVVVYLGDHEWIEADPTGGKVHTWRSSASDGAWYETMAVHRWAVCDGGGSPP